MRFVFTMTDEMYEDLKTIAEKRDTTMAQLVRGLLSDAIIEETQRQAGEYRLQIGGKRGSEDQS